MFTEGIHYNKRLERDMLGMCLLDARAFGRIYKLIEPDMFYYDDHKTIFYALLEMFELGRSIDLETACFYLLRDKNKREIGGSNVFYFLSTLTNEVIGSSHMEAHAYIMRDMYIDRQVISLQHGGWKPQGEPLDKVNEVINRLVGLRGATVDDHDIGMDEGIIEMLAHQQKMREKGGMGIPYGIRKLDQQNGGAHGGEFILIAARPGVGKTAFAGQTALSMAKAGYKIGFISLEMKRVAMVSRLASVDTQTDFKVFYRGKYDDESTMENVWPTLSQRTAHLPIRICDRPRMNTADVKAQAQKWKNKYGLDVLFIDYLQLIKPMRQNKNGTRENEVSEISRELKETALELDIPLIAMSQLNREAVKRTGESRFPRPSDLRESGSLEQDPDVIMFLHSDYIIEHPGAAENERHLIIKKWRNEQSELMIMLDWIGSQMRFAERPEFQQQSNWRRVEVDPAM